MSTFNPGQQQQQQQQQQQAPQLQQQQQQQQPVQVMAAPGGNIAPAGFLATAGGLEGYDMSSLDQLQAHALQLSASAGLTNLLLPNGQQVVQQQPQQQGQQQQGQQQQAQGVNKQQQPFIFLQPAANGNQGLQQLTNFGAPAVAQQGDNSNNGAQQQQQQAQIQSFVLAGNPGGQLPAPANLSQQLFAAAASQGGAALALAPNGTVQPNQQSYSSAGIPIPMPMLVPQQQQQLQGQQLQPLQPAPSLDNNKTGAAPGGGLAGTKRVHESSVVSASTTSMGSMAPLNIGGKGVGAGIGGVGGIVGAGTTANSLSMDMSDFPEFQLRNKDGSVITEKDLEKMSPAERRRYERNLREQQRSFRISQQIQQLKDVLSESKVPFKPNKYSILVSVADYIKQLQTRAIMLDSEHKKLFKTIQETNEMVASGQIPDPNTAGGGGGADDGAFEGDQNATNDQGDRLFVQGLDYQAVFEQTPTANGVASIDGRILACNTELESILDCPREQIERQSLFTLVQNHQEIFEAMAELLKRADALSNGSLKADPVQMLYWSGEVTTPGEQKLGMNITLACTKEGSPKFFSFCMGPAVPSS